MSQVKRLFFDRPGMMKGLDSARWRFLSKAGAFVRTTARQSIRRRKNASNPGSPPSSHIGLLKRIFFWRSGSWKKSVKIGPVKLNMMSFNKQAQPVTGLIPEVLEYGGTVGIKEVQFPNGKWWRRDLRRRRVDSWYAKLPGRLRYVVYRARPFMRPALKKNQPKFPAMWRDQFSKRGK